jgi:Xaa-Pro aminopeptidase
MNPLYPKNRQRLLRALAEQQAAAVFATGAPPIRNNDCEYRFRPDSDFWYLTGFAEPNAVLVLLPGRDEQAVLFLQEKDPRQEVWTGRRLGTAAAPETLGVDAARPIEELWTALPELLAGFPRVVYRTGHDASRDRHMMEVGASMRMRVRGGVVAPSEWLDPAPLLHEMRLVKEPEELELMRRAATISAEAHVAAMREARPGASEAELDALLDYRFRKNGSTGQAYNNIVAGGANACVLHYIANDRPLADGDLRPSRRRVPAAPSCRSTRRPCACSSRACSSSAGSRATSTARSRRSPTGASTCTAPATGSVSTCTTAAPTTSRASRESWSRAW